MSKNNSNIGSLRKGMTSNKQTTSNNPGPQKKRNLIINPSNVDAATYAAKPKTNTNQNQFPKAWDDGPAPEPKKFNKEPLDDGQKPYNTNFEKMNDNQ